MAVKAVLPHGKVAGRKLQLVDKPSQSGCNSKKLEEGKCSLR